MHHSFPPLAHPVPLLIHTVLLSILALAQLHADPGPCAPPPAGLLAWWRAEGDAADSTGGNNGVLTNGTAFAPGVVGQAFHFDGASGFVSVPSSPELKPTAALTVEAWILMDDMPAQAANSIVTKGVDAEVPADWNLSVQVNRKLRPHVNAGGVWGYFDCATTLTTGVWYHVAMVYDGSTLKGYVNGAVDGSVPFSGPIQATDHPLRIGAYAPVNGIASKHFYNGLIDEVSVYERALGSNEIAAIYAAGSAGKCFTNPPCPSPAGLVAYYPFSGDADDHSGNGNHAVASNTTFVPDLFGAPDSAMAFSNVGLVNCGNRPAFQFGQSNFTLTALVNAPSSSGGAFKYILSKEKCYEQGSQFRLEVRDTMVAFGLTDRTGAQMGLWDGWWRLRAPLPVGTWAGVTVVRDGLILRLYVNGQLENSVTMTGSPDHTNSHAFLIGARHGCSATYGDFFHGALDEIRVYDRALGSDEVLAVYQHDFSGSCSNLPPTIVAHPQSQSVTEGNTALFTVQAAGTPPLSYQWLLRGIPIAGETGPGLVLSNVQPTQAGDYSVAVSNPYGAVTSSVATLTVLPPPCCFLSDDFDPDIDLPQWQSFTGLVLATNHGGVVSAPNALWFGGDGQRSATTRLLDASLGGTVQFWLRIADGGSFPWERADLPGEGIVLEYATDGGTNWTEIGRYDTTAYTTWTQIQAVLPPLAQGPTTQLRWRQLSNSGADFDHWALDNVAVPTGPQPPEIVSQPADLTVFENAPAQFSVQVFGSPPLSFQWRLDNTAITNATNAVFFLPAAAPTDAGTYSVVVSNAFGQVTSSNAILTVRSEPPTLTQQPIDLALVAGKTATFSATTTGALPLSYQWSKDGTVLSGATNTSFTIVNVQSNDAGLYQLAASNQYGGILSRQALLTVLAAPVCIAPPADVVAWWPGESNTWDVVGGFDGGFYQAPSPTLLYSTGMVGTAFRFQPSWAIAVPQTPTLDLGNGDGFTFETWINPDLVAGTYGIFGWGGSGPGIPTTPVGVNLRIASPGILQALLIKTNGQLVLLQTAPSSLQARLWQHVALTCNTTNGEMAILVNGTVVAQTNMGPTALRTTGVLRLGNAAGPPLYGLLDEPALYARALSQTEIQSIYLADTAGKCPPPPPPCLNTPGIVALWRGEFNALDSAAGNHAILIPTNYPPQLAYQAGQVGMSFNLRSPFFLSVPRSESLDVGKSDGLTVEGWIYPQSYSGVPIVEWTDSNRFGVYLALGYTGPGSLEANLIDVTNGFHRIQAPYAITGTYWAHIALTYSKASGQAALYLNGSAVATTNLGIFTPRTDTDLLVGFHPRYTGTPVLGAPPTSDRRFTGGIDELAVYGRALTSQEIRNLARPRPDRCLEFPPAIGRQPTDQIVLEGGMATFNVAAGGTDPLHFQWFFETTPIRGATNPVVTLSRVTLAKAGGYSVVITNAFGSVSSRVATLTVLPAGQCVQPPPGAVAWWQGENNEWDVFEVSDALWGLNTPAAFTNGAVGTAFRLTGSSYLQVPANPELNVSRGEGFSVEGWIKPDFAFQPQAIFDWNDTRGTVGVGLMLSRTGPGVVEVTLTDTNAISTQYRTVTISTPNYTVGSQTNPYPAWTHMALTFDKPSGRITLFVNGSRVADGFIAPIPTYPDPRASVPFTPATSGNFYLGYRPSGLYSGARFRGGLDEFTVYDRALSESEVRSIYVVAANGKCAPPPPSCLAVIPEIVGWWRGESNTLDSVQDNHGSVWPVGYPTSQAYGPGRNGNGFRLLGQNHVQVAAAPSLDVGTGPGLTLEAWINPSQFRPQPIIDWNSGSGGMGVNLSYSSTGGIGTMELNLMDTLGTPHQLFTPLNTVGYNAWLHVAATYDKASGVAVLYYNGQPITNRVVGSFTPQTALSLYFGYRPPGAYPGSGLRFAGSMDEMAIYRRALTADEIRSSYRNRVGKCTEPPIIVEHPVSQRVNVGSPVVISGVVTGNPLLRYQWFMDGNALPGAGNHALEFLSAQESHQGVYAFTVSNHFGRAVSSNALLLVNYPPVADASLTLPLVISPNNLDAMVVLDGSLTTDPDDDPLSYQWFSSLNGQPSTLVATDAVAVVTLPVGRHLIELVVDDGLLRDTNIVVLDVITVVQAVENLIREVQDARLEHRKNLVAILSAALASIERGNPTAAINQLQAFQHQVLAQVAPSDGPLAARWVQQAQQIIDILQGGGIVRPNRGHIAARAASGKVSLEFEGAAARIYLIEASSDMVHWQRIGAARHRGNGRFEFEDPQANNRPSRFYRIVTP